MATDTNDRLNTSERPIQKKSQIVRFCFLLPRVGLVLLACFITVMTTQLTYGKTKPSNKMAKNSGAVKLDGDGDGLKATLKGFVVTGLPKNANLIIHIHAKNTKSNAPADVCKGPVLFQITDIQADAQGKLNLAKGKAKEFALNPKLDDKSLLKANDLDTWMLNVHNADVTALDKASGEQKPVSVACGPLKANGVAQLKVTKQPAKQPKK